VLALVLLFSLFLRFSALDGYATIDEPRWQERSLAFAQALEDEKPAATYQSEHPGVVVMWIGVAADGIARWVDAAAPTRLLGWELPWRLLHPLAPGIPALTLWARRLSALLTWLCIVALVALVARFWVYRNAYQRDEIAQVLGYVHDHAQVPEDVIIVNADAAVAHSYDGPLALSVLAGPPRDDWVATALQRAVKNHRRIWVLDLPELYEDQQAVIYEQLGRQGRIVDRIEVGSVRATCYYIAENPRFVRALPGVRREYLLGEQIVLRGYDLSLQQAEPGGYVALRLYWEANQAVSANYEVFTHLIGPQGQMISQVDAVPQGYGRPTTDWRPGETIIDEYRLSIPPDAPLGTYELQVGMYNLKTMQRLPLLDTAGQRQTDDEMLINMLPVD
jgi:hypothetical protein